MADRRGTLYVLYRSAMDTIHRDTYLLTMPGDGAPARSADLQGWEIGACPMSTFSLSDGTGGVVAAWETAGQVQWTRIDPATGDRLPFVPAPGSTGTRKHPVVVAGTTGDTLLAWTEDTSWNKGGGLAWQVFDKDGRPTPESGRAPGLPAWDLVAAAPRPDGGFTIFY
jgi:hypothetical protein